MAHQENQSVDSIIAELKPKLASSFEYLEKCKNYMSREASEIFEMLSTESFNEDTRVIKGDLLAELGYGKLFVRMWNNIPSKNSLQRKQRLSMTRAYWNYTDLSKKLCLALGKAGALELILKDLENLKGSNPAHTQDQIYTDLAILYNCARLCDENREIFRKFRFKEKNTVDILSGYLDDSVLVYKTISLLTLAYVVEENESEKLATTGTGGCLSFLVSLLEESLANSEHRARSALFTTEEILAGLDQLAENDTNKAKIVKEGGVALITKILKDGYCEMERVLAARVLWRLAFVESNREVICRNEDTITALKEFKTCEVVAVREACGGALWELYEGHVDVTQENDSSMSRDKSNGQHAIDDVALHSPHVMISYQWDAQEQMLQLKDKLSSQGYNVWMDVDRMEGNILATMAEAVEKAKVVLIGLSRKYKESTNCRTEASYAYKLKKQIVPLLVENEYEPDGWLGALAGMLLYYRTFSEEVMSIDFIPLVKELGNRGMKVGSKVEILSVKSDSSLAIEQHADHKSSSSLQKQEVLPKISNITSWSKEQVQSWLHDKGLGVVDSQISSYCDGKHLYQMYRQFQRSPAFFESKLDNDLHLDFHAIIKFMTALEDLFAS